MRAGILVAMFGLSIGGGCNPYKYNTVDAAIGSGGYSTIEQIQDPSMPSGTLVAVGDVVITAIDTFGSATGNIWVEEPSGGVNSGILVYKGNLDGTDLAVGDIVTITNAEKQIYDGDIELGSPPTGYPLVTVIGQGTVPSPMVVDALSVAQMPGGGSNWAPYLGTLVTVENVAVISDPKCVGSCKDNTYDSFDITGVISVQSALAALPGAGSGSATDAGAGTLDGGDCLASVTGVIDAYDGEYSIYPVVTSDITTGGTACPAPEQANGADGTECTDGIDNDGNGYTDCNDYGCQFGPGAWLDPDNCVATTQMTCGCSTNLVSGSGVNKVNGGTSGPVLLRDVFVTAVGTEGYWVSDALQSAENSGLYVFTDDTTPTVVVGQMVPSLQGVPSLFGEGSATGDLAQIELDDSTAATAVTGGTPLPLTNVPVATATSVANGTPYQGSLVEFANVEVTVAPSSANYYQATLTDGTTTFTMSDGAFHDFGSGSAAGTTAVGTCYKTLVGVMNLNTYDPQVRMINPRSAADMVVGGNCP